MWRWDNKAELQKAADRWSFSFSMSKYMCLYLLQGGSNIVINSAGPVSNKIQSSRWLLFKNEIQTPPSTDVSDVKLFKFSRMFWFVLTRFYFCHCVFRLKQKPACTRLGKLSWDTTSVLAQRLCPFRPRRCSSDLFTQRNLTPTRAAKKQEILDTTPTKKATRRWATPQPPTVQ